MQTRALIILILAGLFCGFVMYQTNMGASTFAFEGPELTVEKIVWTPNTGFTLYVECVNCDANVTQILVNGASQNVTSPKLPYTLKPTLDLAIVVAFPYTTGTNYSISVIISNGRVNQIGPVVHSFQGGINWAVPPPPPPPYYAPEVTVGLLATLVELFLLSALCTLQTKRKQHLIIDLIIVVILVWAIASLNVLIAFQPPLTFG